MTTSCNKAHNSRTSTSAVTWSGNGSLVNQAMAPAASLMMANVMISVPENLSTSAVSASAPASQHDATDAALYREMRAALAEYEAHAPAPAPAWDQSTSATSSHRQQQKHNSTTIPAAKTRLPPRQKAFHHALRSVLAQVSCVGVAASQLNHALQACEYG